MTILESDIQIHGSAVMPEDDLAANIGGAIDLGTVVSFEDLTANSRVEAISSVAGDVMTMTITGRNAAGEIVTEVKALTGTTVVTFTTIWKRLLKVVLASVSTGTVTLRKLTNGGDLMLFKPGVKTVRRVFYDAAADVAGGATRKFYDKIFVRNGNATDALTNAKISITANPGNKLAFALEAGLDGMDKNGAGKTRLQAPAGYVFDAVEKSVVNNGNHSPLKAQGVWLELTLAAGAAAAAEVYKIREVGTNAA